MKIFDLDLDKQRKIGYYSGIFSICSVIIFLFLAYFMSLNEYDPFTMTLSKLGITSIGFIPFIIGTILGGILISIYMAYYLRNTLQKNKYTTGAIIFGVISGLALIGVGIIQDKDIFLYQVTHTIFAGIFFFSMGLAIFLISYDLKNEDIPSEKQLVYLGFIVCFIAICHFFISFNKNNSDIFGAIFNIAAIWQKITVASYFIWHILLLKTLEKRKPT